MELLPPKEVIRLSNPREQLRKTQNGKIKRESKANSENRYGENRG